MAKALVGILGGVGPAATARLSTLIVERTEARCDQEHVRTLVFNDADARPAPLLIDSLTVLADAIVEIAGARPRTVPLRPR